MTKAIKLLGETGYKVRNIYIAEASFSKEKLDHALFVATVGSMFQIHEVSISVGKKSAQIVDVKVIHQ
jgi:hypothetical protein